MQVACKCTGRLAKVSFTEHQPIECCSHLFVEASTDPRLRVALDWNDVCCDRAPKKSPTIPAIS